MAVRVNIALSYSCKLHRTVCETLVRPHETVSSIKKRIADVYEVPFPDQDLFYDGVVLKENLTLIDDCGVRQGASLEFVPQATTAILVQQLTDSLQAKSMSVDELGLIYTLTNGGSVSNALRILGLTCTLAEFLKMHKCFLIDGASVTFISAASDVAPETFVGADIIPIEEEPRVDVSAWRSVGASIFAALRESMDDDDIDHDFLPRIPVLPVPSNDPEAECKIDVEAWRSVGSQMRNIFAAAHDDEETCIFTSSKQLKYVVTDVVNTDEDTDVGSPRDEVECGDSSGDSDTDACAWKSAYSRLFHVVRRAAEEEEMQQESRVQ